MSTVKTENIGTPSGSGAVNFQNPISFDNPAHRAALVAEMAGFSKADALSPCLFKAGATALQVKAETAVTVHGTAINFPAAAAVTMPLLDAGTDYSVYVCADGSVRASDDHEAPAGYSTEDSRKIGGFHYALDFEILSTSIWDEKFRPAASNPRGMTLVNGMFWCDIYLLGCLHATNGGTSLAGVKIADGEDSDSFPEIPESLKRAAFGACRVATTANITLSGEQTIDGVAVVAGDRVLVKSQSSAQNNGIYVAASGSWTRAADMAAASKLQFGVAIPVTLGTANGGKTFRNLTNSYDLNVVTIGTDGITFASHGRMDDFCWWTAVAVLAQHGKQLLSGDEFTLASAGVAEHTNCGSDPVNTGTFSGLKSAWGVEQAAGCLQVWIRDGAKPYNGDIPYAGGNWYDPYAGSRRFGNVATEVWSIGIGARGRCDHLLLA